MRLSIIMPVYNERRTLEEIVARVLAIPVEKELIIVDDGSTDGTRELLAARFPAGGSGPVRVLLSPANRGKGAAIRMGLEAVTGDAVVIQDADLEYDPRDLVRLLEPIRQGRADVVYGSRVLGRNPWSSWSFYAGGRFLTFLANLLFRAGITDEPTCYKMFRTGVIRSIPLRCRGFEFCPEVTARVRRRGHRIIELPISYSPRRIAEGKKIRWKDGLVAVWTLIRCRLLD